MTEDFRAFLTARLDEDKRTATAAQEGYFDLLGASAAEEAFVARWDPAGVLAEVETKRAILAHHRTSTFTDVSLGIRGWTVCLVCHCVMDEPDDWDEAEEWRYPLVQYQFPCPTLRLLAQPYADHPDYQAEWNP